jgi:hypothetical protein
MPVIHVRGLHPDGGTEQLDAALRLIAREVAATLGEEPRSTWCTFTPVTRMSLGERIVEQADRIVYLDVWMRPRDEAIRSLALEAACRAAARGLDVPIEDVWAAQHVVEAGYVFAGGMVVSG